MFSHQCQENTSEKWNIPCYYPTAANTVQVTVQIYSDIVLLSVQYCRKPVGRTGRRAHAKLSRSNSSFIDELN